MFGGRDLRQKGPERHDVAQKPAAARYAGACCRASVSQRSAPLDGLWLNSESAIARLGEIMIAIGIILLIIGFVTGIAIVWTIGIIVLVLGLIALLLGTTGHAIGGRRHYW
jgi:Family of unknown function (DUF6131)